MFSSSPGAGEEEESKSVLDGGLGAGEEGKDGWQLCKEGAPTLMQSVGPQYRSRILQTKSY